MPFHSPREAYAFDPTCRFMAFDRHMNMVLGDAEELRKLPPKKNTEEVCFLTSPSWHCGHRILCLHSIPWFHSLYIKYSQQLRTHFDAGYAHGFEKDQIWDALASVRLSCCNLVCRHFACTRSDTFCTLIIQMHKLQQAFWAVAARLRKQLSHCR